jgi:hypothetical protein
MSSNSPGNPTTIRKAATFQFSRRGTTRTSVPASNDTKGARLKVKFMTLSLLPRENE